MYSNYKKLKENEILGKDYRINVYKNNKKILIAAPHGGRIEPLTSEIAQRIASTDYSLYLFEGLKEQFNCNLHIKSTDFDEPLLLRLLKESEFVLTVHGLKDKGNQVLVGGLDEIMKKRIVENLKLEGFNAASDCSVNHSGTNPENICNRHKGCKGIQLEIMRELRDRLSEDSDSLTKFVDAVRVKLKEIE